MPVQWKNCQKGRYYAVALPLSCWWWLMVTTTLMTTTLLKQGAAGDASLATKLASQESDPKCHNFSKGWKQTEDGGEFYSPNYPNNYFNSTECTLTLIAPMNHVIEVDFRDRFEIEPSTDCRHDYLEIYDGLGGHRTPITPKLCGMKFPKERILSTGRFLYFRFKSDDTAEYRGFKAVFFFHPRRENVPPMSESCESIETGYDGIIGTRNFSEEFHKYFIEGNEINCLWMINATKDTKVTVSFWHFELRTPNSCEKNFLSIYTKRLDDEHLKNHYCGTQAKNVTYKDVPVYVYLYGSPMQGDYSTFQLHYTVYRSVPSDQSCSDQEFDCGDSSCIHKSLRCNGRVNCKYQTDEDGCTVTVEKMFLFQEKVLVILIIGVLLLLSLAIAMVVSCRRQWKELRKKREEVAARRSMPLGLDHLDPGQTTVMSITDDDHGCYVPEVDLSLFHKRSNGGNAIVFDQETALDKLDPFRRRDSRSSNGSTPPPPPPPKFANSLGVDQPNNRTHTMNTLVLEEDEDEAADIFPPPNARPPDFDARRLRAEAIIQMESQRPRSFESTKSAPDVIVRH